MRADLPNNVVPLHSWAQAGFAVFAPDYRDSGIAGRAAKEDGLLMTPGAVHSHHDVIAGIDHLIDCGIADPDRIYLGGCSWGGLIGARTLIHDQRIRAAAFWEPSLADWRKDDSARARYFMGSTLEDDSGERERASVIPERIAQPVLIMQTDSSQENLDYITRYRDALPRADLVVYRGESHVPKEWATVHDILRRSLAWFSRFRGL